VHPGGPVSQLSVLRRSDPYRVVLIILGPGLLAATASWVVLGLGVEAGNVILATVFAYATLLLWSLPAMPLMALALIQWIPRRPRVTLRGRWPLVLFLVAPLWHLAILEFISWTGPGDSFLLSNWAPIAAAYIPALCFTAVGWVRYLSTRQY